MRRFSKSLKYSLRGIKKAYKEEPNFRIHVFFAILALIFSILFKISQIEWFFILVMITLVFVLEIVNSIFERTIDMVKPSMNEYVKDMKDMMAASVLVAAITSIIIGTIIFLPKIILLLT